MASSEISESVIHAVTPADCCDQYYSGEKNTDLQCFPTLVDNRFYVSLNSLNQGATNTIIFNPDQGLSDIILTMKLPAPSGATGVGSYDGYAMPDQWGVSMINQVALRIGGSSLYYFSMDQLQIDNYTDCEDSEKRQALASLGGGALLRPADYLTKSNLYASVYLKMPFNSISALQKTLPLPTDLLTQPIQILLTFNRFADVAFWYGAGSPVLSNLPTSFESAQVNFRKTTMQNSEHLLARRENMLVQALNYPLRYFTQTVFRTNITQSAPGADNNFNTINLTGFRSGSLKDIVVYARAFDQTGTLVPGYNAIYAPIKSVRLLINGLVMYDAQNNSSIWNLCERKLPSRFQTTLLTPNASNDYADASPYNSEWVVIPFSQICEDVAFKNVVNLGYSIQNSVVNLQLIMENSGSYEVSASYHYVSSLIFTKNTCDYVF
jgi:hypothetical protein